MRNPYYLIALIGIPLASIGCTCIRLSEAFVSPSLPSTPRWAWSACFASRDWKKPLSLLCSDLKSVDEYCYGIDKSVFKLLKKNLPGPYTFILPAKTTLPKGIIMDIKGGQHSSKRQTLGVRITDDPVLRYLQDHLLDGIPLLVSSLPSMGKDDDDDDDHNDNNDDDYDYSSSGETPLVNCQVDNQASWCNEVDFIVDAGPRPSCGSTIFDLSGTRGEPILVREGLGSLELVL